MEREQGMATDEGLTGSERVRKFQTMLHAKAKEEPNRQFHALSDKVWREDFLKEAWDRVRGNGGSAGVDGEGFKDIEAQGVEGWLGELGAGPEGRDLPTEAGAAGTDPEETAWEVPAVGHTLHTGLGGADLGVAGVGADF